MEKKERKLISGRRTDHRERPRSEEEEMEIFRRNQESCWLGDTPADSKLELNTQSQRVLQQHSPGIIFCEEPSPHRSRVHSHILISLCMLGNSEPKTARQSDRNRRATS